MPYTAMQSLLDPLWPAGAQNYFTGVMLDQLAHETIDTLLARHADGRAPVHELHLHHGGGAMSKAPAGGTAFAHRNAAQVLNIIARSPDREGFQEHVDWARETHNAMDPWSTGGGYVNFTSEPGQDKVQASYPPDTYARLVAVKDRDDLAAVVDAAREQLHRRVGRLEALVASAVEDERGELGARAAAAAGAGAEATADNGSRGGCHARLLS